MYSIRQCIHVCELNFIENKQGFLNELHVHVFRHIVLLLFYHALLVTVLVKIQPSRSTSAAAGPIACAPVLRAGNPIAHILQVLVTATLKGNIKQPLTTCVYEDRTRLLQRANGAKKGDRDELALG